MPTSKNTRRVTLVSRLDFDGATHEGGNTITVPAGVARDLILTGKARPADETAPAKTAPADPAPTDRDPDTSDAPALAADPEAPADGDSDKAPAARRARTK